MPIEVTPELVTETAAWLPSYTGHLVRAVVLGIVHTSNSSMAGALHEANKPKPYSVTSLNFRSTARTTDSYSIDSSYPATFKVRFLEDEYASDFLSSLKRNDTINFGGTNFRVIRIHVRTLSYQALVNQTNEADVFQLIFKSPTYLASKMSGFHYLFPEPVRLFLNLAKLWNRFAQGFEIADLNAYARWLRNDIGVTGYELRTRQTTFGERQAVGFKGWVNFRLMERNQWNKATLTLAKFAELSNVGANRTGGFGVVRFYPK